MFLQFCLFFALSNLTASEFSIINLAGEEIVSKQVKFSDVELIHDKGRIALKQLASVQQRSEQIDWLSYQQGILLHDGSWIPVSILVAGDKDDTIQASTPFGPMLIPLEFVAAWGAYHLLKSSDEHDFVMMNNNNKLYGEVHGISDGKLLLQTTLSEDPIPAPMENIRAVRLRAQAHSSKGLYINVFTNPHQPPMKVLPGKQPSLAFIPSITFENWQQCQSLQVIGGNRTFLNELKPSNVIEKALFGKVWHYSLNTNIDGKPLYLNQKRYEQAVVMHSYAKITWDIGEAYTAFHSHIGISDQLKREGDCIVRIFGDDKKLWEKQNIRGAQAAEKVALDLKGVKLLTIEVDYGERFDIGDHVAFADAYLSK